MNETIRARLAEVVAAQEDEDARLHSEMVNGAAEDARKKRIEEISRGGPAIVPALLKSLCRAWTPSCAWSGAKAGYATDINRLHPSNQQHQHSISNLQSSTTGHHLADLGDEAGGIQARVLVVNVTPERSSGGYVGLMNGVFAAQKRVRGGRARQEGER